MLKKKGRKSNFDDKGDKVELAFENIKKEEKKERSELQ